MVDEGEFEIKNGPNTQWSELLPKPYEEEVMYRPIQYIYDGEDPMYPLIPCFHRVASFERDFRSISPSYPFAYFPPRYSSQNIIPQMPAIQPTQQGTIPKEPVFMVYEEKNPCPLIVEQNWYGTCYNSHRQVGMLPMEERRRIIERYLKKKKRRNYANKSYPCRRLAAISRPRLHGRFISNKSSGIGSSSPHDSGKKSKPVKPKKLFHIRKVR
jgi:hypothetical protein